MGARARGPIGWRRGSRSRQSGEGPGLLTALRTMARYFGLANLALALPVATVSAQAGLGLAVAWGSAAAVAAWLVWGSTRRRLHAALDAAGLFGVGLLGTLLGTSVIGVALAALCVRALHGRRRDAVGVGVLLAAAYTVPVMLTGPPGDHAATAVLSAALLLLAAPVLNGVGQTLLAHEASLARGRALHRASTALHDAQGHDHIGAITLETARQLVAEHRHTIVAVALVSGGELVGGDPQPGTGARLPLDTLADAERAALAEGRPVTTQALEVRADGLARAGRGPREPALLVPLSARHCLRGVIAVAPAPPHDQEHRCDCLRLLETLGGQAAMAVDSTTLTDDLIRSETRFRSLVQHSSDVIVLLDFSGRIRYVSPAVARMLGHAPAALANMPFEGLVHPDDLSAWRQVLQRVVAERVQAPLDCRLEHRRSTWRHAEILATNLLGEPSVGGVVLNVRDVSERRVLEDELLHRAWHDPLTGIPNRARFLQEAGAALARGASRDRVAVLFIDLDGFKLINDSFGHATGDGILLSVASRLGQVAPPPNVVARLSGDEFAVLLPDVGGAAEALRIAERVHAVLGEPHRVHNQVMRVSASVGVATGGSSVEDPEDLLHRADLAMYAVKASSKNGVEILSADTASPEGSRQLQADLQWAVLRGEFEVRYQPILRVSDGTIAGAEALVRWRHPVKGLLGPDTFIPMAESSELIGDVFEHVLRDACAAACGWQHGRPGQSPVSVSVNLSAVQLQQVQLLDQVRAALADSGLPPGLLTLEITESVLVEDPHHAIETLSTLKQLGVRIAVDDFGTGYSSLAYLRRLPIDILKVDRMFLAGIDGRDDAPLARMIIDLGKRLAMPTVAEGVERRAQLDALRVLGCDFAQGHLFSRAVSADRVAAMLADERVVAS